MRSLTTNSFDGSRVLASEIGTEDVSQDTLTAQTVLSVIKQVPGLARRIV